MKQTFFDNIKVYVKTQIEKVRFFFNKITRKKNKSIAYEPIQSFIDTSNLEPTWEILATP